MSLFVPVKQNHWSDINKINELKFTVMLEENSFKDFKFETNHCHGNHQNRE